MLISEILLDPTVASVFIESGEIILPLGIDYELDYPSIRILEIYSVQEKPINHTTMFLPITNHKINILEGNGFSETAILSCHSEVVEFWIDIDEEESIIKLFLFNTSNVCGDEEDFAFLNVGRNLYIYDCFDHFVQVLSNPNIDDEFNQLTISYLQQSSTPSFYITNFLWDGYRKPIFTQNLEDIIIRFS